MKKVVFAITKSNFGGAQRYLFDIATNLPPHLYTKTVVMGRGGILQDMLKKEGIKTHLINSLERDTHIIKEIKSFIEFFKIIKKERPDILHLNSSKVGLLGGLCGRALGVKHIIFTAHGWAHLEERPVIQRVSIWILHIITILLSHNTIAVSHKVRNQIKPSFLKKKIVVIHNGVKKQHALPRSDARRALSKYCKSPIKDTDFIVGTISELHKNKGLPYAISAFQNIPNAKFLIIGSGEEALNLETLVTDYNLSEKIFFCGFIQNAFEFIRAFDIFLLSSVKEGFPYVLLEAGQQEVPLIATSVGGIPELVTKETGILIEKRSPQEITNAIRILQNNRDLQLKLGSAVGKRILNQFTFEKMLKETMQLYESN